MTDTASAVISSTQDLERFFAQAARPRPGWLIGLEQEKIGVRSDGSPVPYDGPQGVAALLRALEARGFEPTHDGAHVIGAGRHGEEITLEPGMQVELSAPPLSTALACRELLLRHLHELSAVARGFDIRFIAGGFRPFGTLADIGWLPKRRYDIMRTYLPRHGKLGHEMMKRTATVQVNLDFADEADACDKIRVGMGLSSLVTALYASSPLTEGKPNGYKSYRAAVWLDMDDSRCGLLPFAFEPGFAFRHYVEWALDVPMFFVSRGGHYQPVEGLTFRRFWREGWGGQPATLADWALHLSTVFPEVRLKRTIEMRGADASIPAFSEALSALWRGVLDDPQARQEAWGLVANATMAEREALRRSVPRAGLAAELGGRPIAPLVTELVEIARTGLARLPDGIADQPLLDPLRDYARRRRSPADDLLADFDRLGGDPRRLVDAWELSPENAAASG